MTAQIKSYTIENAELVFKNFQGRPTPMNSEGDRNFNVFLPDVDKAALEGDGWTVSDLCSREDPTDCRPKMKVGVRFDIFPPNIQLITNEGRTRTRLTEDTVGILDTIEIQHVDLIVRPYDWEFGGKRGTKAMVKTMFVTALEDELERKYGVVPVDGEVGDGNFE